MATLSIPKNYDDGTLLFEGDLDDIRDNILDILNVTKLSSDNFQNGGVNADDSVDSDSIIGAKLVDSIVDDITLERDSSSKIRIKDSSITTAKIKDNAVTYEKLASMDRELSSDIISSALGGSFSDIASTSITSTGRPILIVVSSDSTDSGNGRVLEGFHQPSGAGGWDINANLRILRGATDITGSYRIRDFYIDQSDTGTSGIDMHTSSFGAIMTIDEPSSGSHTYKLQANKVSGTVSLDNFRLEVMELF